MSPSRSAFARPRAALLRALVALLAAALACGCNRGDARSDAGAPDADASSDLGVAIDADADPVADATEPCGPRGASTADAGAPNVPVPASGCTRDIDCPDGQFCYATRRACVDPTRVGYAGGDGRGARRASGDACQPALGPAPACDAFALAWSPSINVSRAPHSLVESDTVLAADGHGTIVAAWASVGTNDAVSQSNWLGVSHDDGATFRVARAPVDAADTAANDPVLAYDPSGGLWYYVWEGYAQNFHGEQHVWMSSSRDGEAWTTPVQVDPRGESAPGTPLDFPWVSVNPVDHLPYVTYTSQPSGRQPSLRLVVPQESDGGAPASIELDDGRRPGVDRNLVEHAFDAAGRFYAAWLEMGDATTQVGGVVSGGPRNAIYLKRVERGPDGRPVMASTADVRVSHTGDAVTFDAPAIAVTPDGARVHVAYVVGTGGATDVVVATSRDGGQTFAPPVTVNDDPTCATHFHPSVALDERGRLYVFWYDNRDGDGHFFYAVSDDAGASFHANRLVSAPAFPFDTFQYSTGWLGDYLRPAIAGNELYVLWSDGRESDQSHAFFARARLLP